MTKRHRSKASTPEANLKALADKLASTAPKESSVTTIDGQGAHENFNRLVKIRHIPVTWGIPFDEVVFSKWVVNTFRLQMMPWDSVCTTQSTYLPDARNSIHSDFLSTGNEWLVMLDSDVIPPPDFLDRLLAHHLPMVGGWYHKKGEPFDPVVYDFDHIGDDGKYKYRIRKEPGAGLEEVDAAGAGVWLMHRDVAKAVGERPYDMEHGGEDLRLCERVKAAGFKIYIDWSVACAHCGVGYV